MVVYFILPIINLILIVVFAALGIWKLNKMNVRADEFEEQVKSKIGSIIKGVTVCNLPK